MTELWVERTGTRRYTGHSSRGAQVLIGSEDVEGVFTPGELLKIALAACSGMSSDQPLARRLGDDYRAVVRVSGDADRDEEVYPLLSETLELDLSGLSEDDRERLLLVVTRAVDLVCTVGRTLKSGTTVKFEIDNVGSYVRLTAEVHGMVQGVGFRWWTRCRALELGLTGYAANQADGRVLVVAHGSRDAGQKLLELLQGGHSWPTRPGRVDKVVAEWSQPQEQFEGFVER